MNQIKLQNLTPDIYYNQSRDFQLIGRLYDVVLNSVKNNSDLLYGLPLSDISDEKLIDLMTMTLGFKSQHNYNIKQLTALCSAFTVIIRNKGNIDSIILAVMALLNAEGIEETLDYSFDDNYTVLNLFIPQTLTDTNLLKDLLVYILPAGMSCNIIKEFRLTSQAATNLTTEDTVVVYEGTYESNTGRTNIGARSEAKSIVSKINEYGITDALAKATPGLLANSDIYRPSTDLYYNITYVTDGGVLTTTGSTQFSYKAGIGCALPTATKAGKEFDYWTDSTGQKIESITTTDVGNKVLYAKWK